MKQKSESNYFTLRVLMTLVHDVVEARKNFEAIEIKIAALAKEHDVRLAEPLT